MSVNININKADLQKAIDLWKEIALYKPLSAHFGVLNNYKFEGGWHGLHFGASYTKVHALPDIIPVNAMDDGRKIRFIGIFYLIDLFESYVFFNEPAPTLASLVEGFYLYGTGSLVVRSAGTPSGTTTMSVASGDIVVLAWEISKVNNVVYMAWGGWKYDWDTDTLSKVIDAYGTVSTPYQFRYIALWEPNNTSGRVLIGYWVAHWGIANSAPTAGVGDTPVFQFYLIDSIPQWPPSDCGPHVWAFNSIL